MRVANVLGIDPAFVVASMHAQRAKRSEEKKLWERIATSMAGMAAALAVIALLPFIWLDGSEGYFLAIQFDTLYIMRS